MLIKHYIFTSQLFTYCAFRLFRTYISRHEKTNHMHHNITNINKQLQCIAITLYMRCFITLIKMYIQSFSTWLVQNTLSCTCTIVHVHSLLILFSLTLHPSAILKIYFTEIPYYDQAT